MHAHRSTIHVLLAILLTSCMSVEDPPPEAAAGNVEFLDPSSSMPGADAPITAPPGKPRNSEPPCDDDGDCCPEGTTPVLGTQAADVFTTSTPGLCHVLLGGSDVLNNTSGIASEKWRTGYAARAAGLGLSS
jgi:hypothetical protein